MNIFSAVGAVVCWLIASAIYGHPLPVLSWPAIAAVIIGTLIGTVVGAMLGGRQGTTKQ